MERVQVKPEILRWAVDRAGIERAGYLGKRFIKLQEWVKGDLQPTFKQLEDFASSVHVPIGYLFLSTPPEETLPIPDFRTLPDADLGRPSPDLLDTIYAMQRRQWWLRETLMDEDADSLDFVRSAGLKDDPEAIGREMRRVMGFEDGWASKVGTWQEAVSELRRAIEELGVMAVINGVVANNTHRPLSVREFRGFALCDDYAPLIFVNGADSKSAQMFTMAHELAHVWLGQEGLSGFEWIFPGGTDVETFCDKAAAEFLIPARELKVIWKDAKRTPEPFLTAARHFKVSPIVAGRRAMDLHLVDRETFFEFYRNYTETERPRTGQKKSGGDFYNNQNNRVGNLFAVHVIRATKEGRIGFKEAYDLTGLGGGAFQEYASKLGFHF